MNWAWILMPLLGAAIGYSTNWIAVKMLFRPHKEKFLFGVKVPFTPGLMPKERYKLSRKISKTLSERVLTGDVLMQAVTSPEVTEKISDAADVFLEQYLLSKTINEVLPQSAAEWLAEPSSARIVKIAEFLKYALDNNPEVEETLTRLVAKIAAEQFGAFVGLFIKYNELYGKIKASFFEYLEDETNQNVLAEKVDAWIVKTVNMPISENEFLHDWFNKEETREKIKAALCKAAVAALEKGGAYVIDSIDISKVIEEQINRFDVAETEKIVLAVMGNQLHHIMAIGGVLGFIVGFLPLLFGVLN